MKNSELVELFEGIKIGVFLRWAKSYGVDITYQEVYDHKKGKRVITKFPELCYRVFFAEMSRVNWELNRFKKL